MKKLLILVITAAIALSFIACTHNEGNVINSNTNSNSNENADNNNKVIDKKITIEDASNINIDVSVANITIKVYDGNEVKVTGKLSENSTDIDLNRNSNTIELKENGTKKNINLLNMTNDKDQKDISTLDILIPSKLNGNFQIKQDVGTSDISGLNVKNLDIAGGTGDIKYENIVFDKLKLEAGAAKAYFKLNKKCGDITIEGGVGETNIDMEEVGGNLTYKGGVGKLDIKLPENSPVKFEKNNGAGLGGCNINAKTSDEGKYIFDLKVGVGSINIHN